MKQISLIPEYVDYIPEQLAEGSLYICEQYRTAVHKCCCGCGEEVVTPLSPAEWSIRKEGNTVTLLPSIGNWSFACQSHYWIRKNQVIWAKAMSQQEIKRIRARDAADKAKHIAYINQFKEERLVTEGTKSCDENKSYFKSLWVKFIKWINQ